VNNYFTYIFLLNCVCLCIYLEDKKYKIKITWGDPYSTLHLRRRKFSGLQEKNYPGDYRKRYLRTFRMMKFIVLWGLIYFKTEILDFQNSSGYLWSNHFLLYDPQINCEWVTGQSV